MKKKKTGKPPFILPDGPDGQDQRDAFRYVFAQTKRIEMRFKQEKVTLLNISAGGLAFENRGFKQYETDRITLALDIPNYPGDAVFTAWTRILHVTQNNICHCIFEHCLLDDYEIVHKFVLEMQKQDINKNTVSG